MKLRVGGQKRPQERDLGELGLRVEQGRGLESQGQ